MLKTYLIFTNAVFVSQVGREKSIKNGLCHLCFGGRLDGEKRFVPIKKNNNCIVVHWGFICLFVCLPVRGFISDLFSSGTGMKYWKLSLFLLTDDKIVFCVDVQFLISAFQRSIRAFERISLYIPFPFILSSVFNYELQVETFRSIAIISERIITTFIDSLH